ncbi:MAG: hypothetical protein LBG91_01335 [Treponema sp.]|nr:hypothetical protein [Treponema sp.]
MLHLSGGQEYDAPAGRLVLETAGKQERTVPLLMDRAYADFKTRFTALDLRFQALSFSPLPLYFIQYRHA